MVWLMNWVSSLGEALAGHCYGLELMPHSYKGYDAVKDGKKIEIKATLSKSVSFVPNLNL